MVWYWYAIGLGFLTVSKMIMTAYYGDVLGMIGSVIWSLCGGVFILNALDRSIPRQSSEECLADYGIYEQPWIRDTWVIE